MFFALPFPWRFGKNRILSVRVTKAQFRRDAFLFVASPRAGAAPLLRARQGMNGRISLGFSF
jgi:hypothetical protein